jgi:pimeloyl-ACP methyl ester carboxylesterase
VTGAIDRRVRCVVAQVPTISGWRTTLRRFPFDGLAELRARCDADREARLDGAMPVMVPVAAGLDLEGARDQPADRPGPIGNDGARWCAAMAGSRLTRWENAVTLRSLERYAEYEPGSYVERVAPTPLLVVCMAEDTVTPADEILGAYERAREPKRLALLPGGHYDAYVEQRDAAAGAAAAWFAEHLGGK